MNARLHSLFPVVVTAAFLTVLAGMLSSQAPTQPALTLLSKDGRRALPMALVADQEFVALDELAPAFQLTVHEESLGAVTVSYKGKTIVLTPDQALASVAGRLVSLPAPPSRSGRRWLVPVEFISRAVSLIYDAPLDLRKASRLLVIGDLRVPRITARYDSFGSSGRLTIDATPRATATVTQEAEHLTLKFDADALDVANPPLPTPGSPGLILGLRVVDATTMAVDLGPRFAGFRATSQPVDTIMRLVIDLVVAQTDAAAAAPATPAPPPPPPSDLPPSFGQTVSAFRTIAIDAGHGGDDEGVRSAEGVKEKDLTLAIARRVRSVIEARLGLRVLLTRDDDRSVPVDERASLANNNQADLFVSLHANGSMRRNASGASIYVAAFDRDAAQASAGGGERVPTFGGGSREIELVPWNLAQTRHLDQSSAFAALLQQALQEHVPLSARPIERAPLRVLESANMPAILVELGYLTNPEQAKMLASDAFQNSVAQALLDAIVKFRDAVPGGGTH
ncbi:MAG TPA: N-acetylmuramoyl-L-alanine amidase [Vicinamibacterales bacterium]|nr:N-acetylmuramoyl-L-alanine amidase [Vicinamibacterales bacterium]